MGKTLAEKVWDEHVVRTADGEPDLLYIDLHLSTRSPARRPSTGCGWPVARCAVPT